MDYAVITNRAKYGKLAGQPWMDAWDGKAYPTGANGDDPDTQLQPGGHIRVSVDAAMHFFGDFQNPAKPSKADIIRRHGDYEFAPSIDPNGMPIGVARNPPTLVRGYPPLPDILIQIVNEKDEPVGPEYSVLDLYCSEKIPGIAPIAPMYDKPKTTAAAKPTAPPAGAQPGG